MSSAGIYHVSTWRDPVADGVSDTRFVSLEGYAKVNNEKYPYCVANEYLASRLAVRLGITVPPGTLVHSDRAGETGWVTLTYGDPLPPVVPENLAVDEPRMTAGLVVFDIFIINTDRHTRNVAYRPSQKRLEVFDHSHALFGPNRERISERLSEARGKLAVTGKVLGGHRQCLMDHIAEPEEVLGWADKLETECHNQFLIEACREIGETGLGPTKEECDEMAEFLLSRRDHLKNLILDEKDEFSAIEADEWGLM